MTEKEYAQLVQKAAPKSPMGKDCLNAFWIGGLICVLGQILTNGFSAAGLEKDAAATATSITLVTLSALLTGLSLYDNLAKYGGAGTLVPITGFANAIAAPAVEFKTDACAIIGPSRKAFDSGEYDDLVQKIYFSKGGAYIQRWEHRIVSSVVCAYTPRPHPGTENHVRERSTPRTMGRPYKQTSPSGREALCGNGIPVWFCLDRNLLCSDSSI